MQRPKQILYATSYALFGIAIYRHYIPPVINFEASGHPGFATISRTNFILFDKITKHIPTELETLGYYDVSSSYHFKRQYIDRNFRQHAISTHKDYIAKCVEEIDSNYGYGGDMIGKNWFYDGKRGFAKYDIKSIIKRDIKKTKEIIESLK